MLDIVTFGSALVDIFVDTGLKELKAKKKRFIAYNVGEKFLIQETEQFTGGGGTNTAVGFARMGLNTGIITKLGNDWAGDVVLKELKKENIKFLGKVVNEKSAFSVILDSYEHNRTILTYKSITNEISIDDFKIPQTKWLYFSSLMKESHKTQEKLAALAKLNEIKTAYNPSSYQTKKGRNYLVRMIRNIDILIFNLDEAKMISKKKKIKDILQDLCSLGPDIVCITDGAKSVDVFDGKHYYSAIPHKIKVKERTGAGDGFASGFVSAYIKKKDIPLAIKVGITNSESVIMYKGAKNKLLKYYEAIKTLKKMPIHVRASL